MTLPERLKKVRAYTGKSQKDISSALGISTRTWQIYEEGGSVPGGKVLEGLANIGIDINWLLTGVGEMARPVILNESQKHMALRDRLLYKNTFSEKFDSICNTFGIDYNIVKKYIYEGYIPTEEELERLCFVAGRWDFEFGEISKRQNEVNVDNYKIGDFQTEIIGLSIEVFGNLDNNTAMKCAAFIAILTNNMSTASRPSLFEIKSNISSIKSMTDSIKNG